MSQEVKGAKILAPIGRIDKKLAEEVEMSHEKRL
jgi:hypothetical protein